MQEDVIKALNVIKEMARQVVANLETHEVLQHAVATVEAELKKTAQAGEHLLDEAVTGQSEGN